MVKTPEKNVGSKILRERAMAVFRETRAKIDPQFLATMKDRFSSLGNIMAGQGNEKKPLENPPSFLNELNKAKGGNFVDEQPLSKQSYPSKNIDVQTPARPELKAEPVDRQKIAQIVLEYMKNKDNGQRH